MTDVFRLAVAQSFVAAEPAENGQAIRAMMRQASAAGARLAHFPEGAATGYPSGPAKTALAGWPLDWALVRRELEATAELAGELGLWVVVGAAHPLEPPHRPHNSLYVISDQGRLVARYDKRRLSFGEVNDWFTPGFDPLTVDIDGFRFGFALCLEINFPDLFMAYEQMDADAVLVSSFSRDPIFGVLAQGHAAANNMWLSFATPAQCSSAFPSGVVGPHGYWLAQAPGHGAQALAIVDLDRNAPELETALCKARPWRRASREGAVYAKLRAVGPRSLDHTRF
ncbi:carbon-nitrogen hydrolase family protein [Phenylobacterium sp.]|uniref:carbon-nitrogen hydrolase family protein n=1 Tax=Phenylobacterium sp. TaxID=1871053 RepID=UPI0035B23A3C